MIIEIIVGPILPSLKMSRPYLKKAAAPAAMAPAIPPLRRRGGAVGECSSGGVGAGEGVGIHERCPGSGCQEYAGGSGLAGLSSWYTTPSIMARDRRSKARNWLSRARRVVAGGGACCAPRPVRRPALRGRSALREAANFAWPAQSVRR